VSQDKSVKTPELFDWLDERTMLGLATTVSSLTGVDRRHGPRHESTVSRVSCNPANPDRPSPKSEEMERMGFHRGGLRGLEELNMLSIPFACWSLMLNPLSLH